MRAAARCHGRDARRDHPDRRSSRGLPPRLRPDPRTIRTERHRDRPIHVGPVHPRARGGQAFQRATGRVAVGIAGSGGGDRDPWPDRREERIGGGGPAAVMRDLEQVDVRQAFREQRRVDVLLDVARQQESRSPIAPSRTTDTLLMPVPPSGGSSGTWPRIGHSTRIVISSTASRSPAAIDRRAGALGPGQAVEPGRVARARATHPGLEHAIHVIPVEQQGEAGDVILVRVGQDDRVESPVPRRDPPIELDQETIGIGPAVDEQPAAARPLDQDGVALTDIEDRDPSGACRARQDDGAGDRHRHDEAGRGQPQRDRSRGRSAARRRVDRTAGTDATGSRRAGRGRPRDRTMTIPSAAAAVARPKATPAAGSNAMLANGTEAPRSTMPMISRRATQPGAASTEPTTDGAPTLTTAPPTRATSPAAIAGVTSGTTSRFTTGEISSQPTERRKDDRQRRRLGRQ